MVNLDQPKWAVVWGFRMENHFHTHSWIHSGFYRALKHLYGDRALWLDHTDDLNKIDLHDSIIITEHEAAKRGMPIHADNFHIIHGLNNDKVLFPQMASIKNKLGWDVHHDFSYGGTAIWNCENAVQLEEYKNFLKGLNPGPPRDEERNLNRIKIAEDFWYYPAEKNLNFRWATDLLPHEIEENKKTAKPWNPESKEIIYTGTRWFVNDLELNQFDSACRENGITFRTVGAGQNGVVSLEDNVKNVQNSYFSPAISGSHHLTEGYVPCRIFKNISYGRMGITNSKRVNDLFGGRLIFHPDCHQLFYHAKEQLAQTTIEQVHELMDFVADHHTYVNRISDVLKTAKLVMESE